MASINDTTLNFVTKANPSQWSYVLSLYNEVFKLHAQKTRGSKQNGPAELIKLDNWYQNELPKLIKTRKEPHISYNEIVQIAKWKLLRGKFRPGILDLVKTNTDLAVKTGTKKAFKKMPNINSAISALKNLKGIAPATASAILVAFSPEECPFFFDESMISTPGIENTDTFTTTDYLNFCEKIKLINEKLKNLDPDHNWIPHDIELTIWTHYHIKKYDLNLLDNMPIDELNKSDDKSSQNNLENNNIIENSNQEESLSNGLSIKESNNQLNEISNDQSSLSNLSTISNSKNEVTNGDLNRTEFSILEDNNSNSFVSSNSINDEQSNESSQLNKLNSIDKEDSLSNNVSSTNGISENEISTSSKLTNGDDLTKSNNEINNLKTTITTNSQQHFKITTTTCNNLDSNLSNSIQLNTDSSEMKFSSTISSSSSSCENSNNINSSEDSIQLNQNKRKNSSSNSSLSNLKTSKTSISNQLNINLDDNAIFDPDSDQPLSKRQKIN